MSVDREVKRFLFMKKDLQLCELEISKITVSDLCCDLINRIILEDPYRNPVRKEGIYNHKGYHCYKRRKLYPIFQ